MPIGGNESTSRSLRSTLIKSTVGNVKRPAFDLPDSKNPNHIYGYEIPRDEEGVGEVIGNWSQAVLSPEAKCSRSFIETNKQAISSGHITAAEARKFAIEHPGILVKKGVKRQPVGVPPTNEAYGIKTQKSEDITALIQAKHTTFHPDTTDYPDLSQMQIKGRLPLPRDTNASLKKDIRFNPPSYEKDVTELFKMSKFKKVEAVLSTQPKIGKQKETDNDYDSLRNYDPQEI